MYKFTVVICDDEPRKIETLKAYLCEGQPDAFKVLEVATVDALMNLLSTQKCDAVFLDLFYRPPGRVDDAPVSVTDQQVRSIRSAMLPTAKLIIYTQYGETKYEMLRDLAFDYVVDDWLDLNDLKDSKRAREKILRIHRAIGLRPGSSGHWLLQLSDLHVGHQFKFAGEPVEQSLSQLVQDAFGPQPLAGMRWPQVCVVSGDCSNSAQVEELKAARKCITDIADVLARLSAVPRIPIVVTPGNHDFSWNISMIEEHEVRASGTERILTLRASRSDELRSLKWVPFLQTFRDLCGTDVPEDASWWVNDLSASHGVAYICINSSQQLTYKRGSPSISLNDIRAAEKHLQKRHREVTILVTHHPVKLWAETEEARDELLVALYGLGVRVILTGHQHRERLELHRVRGKGQVVEVQTGSAGATRAARGDHDPPQFRVIGLVKKPDGSWGRVQCWNYAYQRGAGYRPQSIDATGRHVDEEDFG